MAGTKYLTEVGKVYFGTPLSVDSVHGWLAPRQTAWLENHGGGNLQHPMLARGQVGGALDENVSLLCPLRLGPTSKHIFG